METPTSHRTSALPDLEGRGATAAKALIVAGPVALLGAQMAATLQSTAGEAALSRVAVPLMLAWAAVLFLMTRTVAPVAAWVGLVAVTLQITLVQEVAAGWQALAIESVGFVAFAIALDRLWWVPRAVPVLLVVFPVVDLLTPEQASVLQLAAFASFVAVGLVLAVRMSGAGGEPVGGADEPQWAAPKRGRVTARSARKGSDRALPSRIVPPMV